MSNTPTYHQVASQPPAGSGSGWLGQLGSLFGGGGTPAYLGEGQPTPSNASRFLTVTTPAYKPAPIAAPTAPVSPEVSTEHAPIEQTSPEQTSAVQAVIACPVDPDPFGSGPITIVIPRQG